MSGCSLPWDAPFEVLFNHNNGDACDPGGLNQAGCEAYDRWQESLQRPSKGLPKQKDAPLGEAK